MWCRARVLVGAFTAVFPITASARSAPAEQPTPVPFDRSLSIYVAHRGTWLNYNSAQQQQAEIEDPVAAFRATEPVCEEPERWGYYQISDPRVPDGWTFFTPVEDRPMKLRVIVRDAQNRLGQAEIIDRDTGISFGTVPAHRDGSHIDGCVPVPPTREAFTLLVRGKDSSTMLFRAAANNPRVADAVAVTVEYGWEPNRGDEHEKCPLTNPGPPWGAVNSADGRKTAHLYPHTMACAGPVEFTNDTPYTAEAQPKYQLREKQVVKDTTTTFEGRRLPPQAEWHLRRALAAARKSWEGGPLLHPLELRPFSRGTGHWVVTVYGEMKAVVCFPYQGRRKHRAEIAGWLQAQGLGARQSGVDTEAPSQAIVAAMAQKWGPCERRTYASRAPVAVGDIWGLRAGAMGSPDAQPETGITTPVTFELYADNAPPGAPGLAEAWASAEVVEPWTDARPPYPEFADMRLDFSDPDSPCTCTRDLAKGWKWRATAQPSPPMAYSRGEVGPFEVPGNDTIRIECHLVTLLCLKIKTVSEGSESVPAQVELDQRGEGGLWASIWEGETIQQPDGEQVWTYASPLLPGAYRARARAGKGPYSEWHEFDVPIGIEQIETVTVP